MTILWTYIIGFIITGIALLVVLTISEEKPKGKYQGLSAIAFMLVWPIGWIVIIVMIFKGVGNG